MIERLDHVAVVVRDLDAALPYYTSGLGLVAVADGTLPEAGVRVVYLDLRGTLLQLVQPISAGSIQDHLSAHGEGLHHVCFAVGDLEGVASRLIEDGAPAIFTGGRARRACFLPQRPNGLRIELTESEPTGDRGSQGEGSNEPVAGEGLGHHGGGERDRGGCSASVRRGGRERRIARSKR